MDVTQSSARIAEGNQFIGFHLLSRIASITSANGDSVLSALDEANVSTTFQSIFTVPSASIA